MSLTETDYLLGSLESRILSVFALLIDNVTLKGSLGSAV